MVVFVLDDAGIGAIEHFGMLHEIFIHVPDFDGIEPVHIAVLGWHVRDTREGPVPVPGMPELPEHVAALHSSREVPSRLDEADEIEFTVVVTGRDDLTSLRRVAESVLRHSDRHEIELIVIDNGSSDGTREWLEQLSKHDARVQPVRADHNLGTGAGRNCGLRLARGRYVVVLDSSLELTDDALTPLAEALDQPAVGVVGPFGVNSEDLRDFEDAPGPEVDAVEGYMMAFRRERVREVGLMDEKFRFYRHLDLDYSLAFREAGYRNRIVSGLPLRRHPHSDWERTPQEERDRLSKRNFYRFLRKHGDRTELLLASSKKG